jgi:hypothetical protein
VTKNGELCSPKAIAFIFNKCSQRSNRLDTKAYFSVRQSPQNLKFLQGKKSLENSINVSFKKIGEKNE